MADYVLLNRLTDQGAKAGKDIPMRVRAAQKEAEKLGRKVTFYVTLGKYDTVGILEAPDDGAALAFVSELASLGNVRTMTLKAFTMGEAEKIMSSKRS